MHSACCNEAVSEAIFSSACFSPWFLQHQKWLVLWQLPAILPQSVSFLVPRDIAVGWDPLDDSLLSGLLQLWLEMLCCSLGSAMPARLTEHVRGLQYWTIWIFCPNIKRAMVCSASTLDLLFEKNFSAGIVCWMVSHCYENVHSSTSVTGSLFCLAICVCMSPVFLWVCLLHGDTRTTLTRPEKITNDLRGSMWKSKLEVCCLTDHEKKMLGMGQTFWEPASNISGPNLTWNPQEMRKRGRLRNIWYRDIDREMHSSGHPWKDIENTAQSQQCCRRGTNGLCSS